MGQGISRGWVAKVRARTHVCDVWSHVCVCVRNDFSNMCAMCVRAGTFKLVTHHKRATRTFGVLTLFPHFLGSSKAECNVLKQERMF
mgnify:CR=1 FL=1